MASSELHVVTGAFGYTGKYITRRLLAEGHSVLTLTGHPGRPNPFGERVRALPFNFDRPAELARSLQGATTLYNTYWVRFSYGPVTFERAVENTQTLINAAQEAGVRRVVHVSITNPSLDSPLPYFKGKAKLEAFIRQSGLSYAIIRPTVIFGPEDILINNIAWLLRRFPLFAIPGSGEYRLQPIFVEDMAGIVVEAGRGETDVLIDAVGPEVYTFNDLVRLVAAKVGSRARLIHLNPGLALLMSRLLSLVVRDVLLTRDEIEGLMAGLLVSQDPPTGHTRLSEWLDGEGRQVGARYASELARHYR
ncbi:MAG: SDR family oxidoreductase [Anaerolineae bacterium]